MKDEVENPPPPTDADEPAPEEPTPLEPEWEQLNFEWELTPSADSQDTNKEEAA